LFNVLKIKTEFFVWSTDGFHNFLSSFVKDNKNKVPVCFYEITYKELKSFQYPLSEKLEQRFDAAFETIFKEFSWQTKYLQKSAPYENIHLVTVSQEDLSKEHGCAAHVCSFFSSTVNP
jgi:hypothetical protein